MQVALAVNLLIGAGLLLRSFQQLGRVSPGFDSSHVLTFRISGNWGETADMKALTQRIDRTLEALRTVPGVEAVATAAALPGLPDHYDTEFKIPDAAQDPTRKILADARYVSAGYFATMRIAQLQGDSCKPGSAASVALVNRSFANTYFRTGFKTGAFPQREAQESMRPVRRRFPAVVAESAWFENGAPILRRAAACL